MNNTQEPAYDGCESPKEQSSNCHNGWIRTDEVKHSLHNTTKRRPITRHIAHGHVVHVRNILFRMDLFSKNLRRRAEELGILNAEVARRASLTERRYGNYVSGRREPDLATLVRIAQVLETTPDALLGFGTANKTKADALRDKVISAMGALANADKEVLAACAEAIVRLRAD